MISKDYTSGQLLETEACTNCKICADVCPAVGASGDGKVSAIYRLAYLRDILKRKRGLLSRIFKTKGTSIEDLTAYSDTVFRCTLCGNCQEVCPVGIHLKDLWLNLRQDLVREGSFPKKIEMIKGNLDESRNVFAEDNEERADWVEDMRNAPKHGFIKKRADIVYFTGCVAAYFPLAQKIPIALAEILQAAQADFTLLGGDEWCCGFPLLGAGLMDMFSEFREHNIGAVKARGAKRVVFACPSCFQMWREHYDSGIEIAHASQFLEELAIRGAIPFKETNLTVTYHDPCDLGRGARVFDAPREVIRSIPGVKLVELPRNRENCRCCGGGGNLEMIDPQLSADIARAKIEEILSTGAQAVITSCQQCVRTMTTYVKRNKVPLEVMDITQLLQKALKKPSK
jgi:heterodisulfide reductase subunit D